MCIIVAKPAGVGVPTQEIFDNCYRSNLDGIGFAYNRPGEKVTICKGFSDVKKLMRMMHTFNIGQEHNLIVHFRLGTHGKKDPGNCHPFPLTKDLEGMRELHLACDTAIAHNGVFGQMKSSEKYSDTMKFVGNILASPEIINNITSPAVTELLRGYCGYSSKLAFLQPQGLIRVGDFEEDEGVFYSNAQYKTYIHKSYNSESSYDWRGGKEWCREHEQWDKCHKNLNGRTWCYAHKKYDHCSYCSTHRTMDNCNHARKTGMISCCQDSDVPFVLDMRKTCEVCHTRENVSYNDVLKTDICEACAVLQMNGQHS